jgi:hypothetical protein
VAGSDWQPACCQTSDSGSSVFSTSFYQPLRSDHGSCMLGLGGIPSAWRSPTTRCPGGNIPPTAGRACHACPRGTGW